MKVSIFGLGYVGSVTAACLAKNGHTVIGVDIDTVKVDLVNKGKSPVIEKNLDSLISTSINAGRFKAGTDTMRAVNDTEISLLCVGTPSLNNGNIDLIYIKRVVSDIGKALAQKDDYHIVVVRSTVLPGTTENIIIPRLEEISKKQVGKDFGVAINPEFLREASAVYDFFHPPKTVIGTMVPADGEKISRLYEGITAPLFVTNLRTAEMIKYADNAFHALKVTFANDEVMNIFCHDTKLNLSPAYLKPAFAFGGSCLPKDLRALTYLGRHNDLSLPVLNAIIPSNQAHIDYALELIRARDSKKIGILGFAFKAGTDDLRESPVVTLIETLLGQGFELRIYDRNISLALLRGANKKFIEERIPHVAALIQDSIDDVISFAQTLVIGNKSEEFINVFTKIRADQYVLDLVRIGEELETKAAYEGICW
jgi:GDP-mannose 6-dehydrogenase